MKKVKGIEKWLKGYNNVRSQAEELQLAFDFYKDELVTEEEVDNAYKKVINGHRESGTHEYAPSRGRPYGVCDED